jgi:hypothetical protein
LVTGVVQHRTATSGKSPQCWGPQDKVEMKEFRPSSLWKRIVTFDDFQLPPRSKGDQETFRRGALVRAETPWKTDKYRKWNDSRSYRVHPYWSSNLKYVY